MKGLLRHPSHGVAHTRDVVSHGGANDPIGYPNADLLADLLASSPIAAWVPSAGEVYQETAKTNVAAAGDPVAWVEDLSGGPTDLPLLGQTGALRPTMRDGYIEMQSGHLGLTTDANLSSAAMGQATMICAVEIVDLNQNCTLFGYGGAASSSHSFWMQTETDEDIRFRSRESSNALVDVTSHRTRPLKAVFTIQRDSNNDILKGWIDGTQVVDNVQEQGAASAVVTRLTVGILGNDTEPCVMNFWGGAAWGSLLSDEDRAAREAYFASLLV